MHFGPHINATLFADLKVDDANTPTLHELMDRAGGRAGGRAPLAKAARAVRADRDAR